MGRDDHNQGYVSDHDKNYKIFGHGPLSLLQVTPLSAKYFGDYTCRAENIYGMAEHKIELILAREPTEIQQAVLDRVTSTSLHYRFVPPINTGGLPLDAYAVEYKETRHQWDDAKRRVWPIAEHGEYILENLSPMTTYDLRFGCKNRVGFSLWGSPQQVTMSVRGKPEAPLLNYGNYEWMLGETEILSWDTSEPYDLSWQLPEDNGVPIDHFRLQYFPVSLASLKSYQSSYSSTYLRSGITSPTRAAGRGPGRSRRISSQGSPPDTPSGSPSPTLSYRSSWRLTMSSATPSLQCWSSEE